VTPLRVAQCPRCQGPLVFGERACRTCGQTFDYGAGGPPVPTDAELVTALAAVGVVYRGHAGPATPPPPPNTLEGLDTGRYADAGDVPALEVAGLMETAMFRAATPTHVDAQRMFDFDPGRFATAMTAPMIAVPDGLERTAVQNAAIPDIAPVPGRFGSDIYSTAHVVVAPMPVDGLDPSPAITRAGGGRKPRSAPDGALDKVLCRCSEVHRLPRCPACGTPHPDRS
jgi:hypothetical protein